MKTLAEKKGVAHRSIKMSISELWRCGWQARARGMREAAILVVCALAPALCLYVHDCTVALATGSAVVAPFPTQILPSDALWIDARSEADYRREHVPGALNLNEENWKDALGQVFELWQPPRPVVVYCSEGCSSAEHIAQRLSEVGVEPVQVFEGGFEKWKQTAH